MPQFKYQFFTRPSELWPDVKALRLVVFVNEMGVPEDMEIDEFDLQALHLSVRDGVQTIGTLRLLFHDHYAKLGRVVVHVDYRRQGIGRQMMQEAIGHCREKGVSQIVLGAQTYIVDFYRQLGFTPRGDIFDDAGIPHQEMFLKLEYE